MSDLVINIKQVGDQVVIGALRKVGEVAISALGAAFSTVADFATDSFKGAIEAQAGIDKMTASITRLGASAPVTTDEVFQLADKFKNLVGGSDDVVIAMSDVALRFDKVGKDIFPRVIEQSADLAATLETDPVQATEKLSKVLQDLGTDGTVSANSLKNAGLQLTQAEQDKINALAKSGKVTEAQTMLLDLLAESTKGAAIAASKTKQWEIFQESIADAGEGVMLKLLPGLTSLMSSILPMLVPLIEMAADWFGRLANQISIVLGTIAAGGWESLFVVFEDGSSYLQGFLELFGLSEDQAAEWATTILGFVPQVEAAFNQTAEFITGTLVPAFVSIVDWVVTNWPTIQAQIQAGWDAAQPVLQAIGDFITNTVIPAFQGAVDWVVTNWPTIQSTIETVINTIDTTVRTVLSALQTFWDEHGASIMTIVETNFNTAKTTIETVIAAIDLAIRTVLAGLQLFWDTWGDDIEKIVKGTIDAIGAAIDTWAKVLKGDWEGVGEDLRKAWDTTWATIQTTLTTALNTIQTTDWGKIGTDIITAISNSLTNAAYQLTAAAVQAALNAISAVQGVITGFTGGTGGAQDVAPGTAGDSRSSSGSGGGIFYVTINVNGASDSGSIASEVMKQIDNLASNKDSLSRTGYAFNG